MASPRRRDLWSARDGLVDIEESDGAFSTAQDSVDPTVTGKQFSRELSLIQKLRLRLFGRVLVGWRNRRLWRAELPFYAFRCPIHGIVEDYPHGYHGRLDCPLCLGEADLIRALGEYSSGEKND